MTNRNEAQLAALEELSSIGSHLIITEEKANEVGLPFGIEFKAYEFKHDSREPKGPVADATGVSTFDIAASISSKLGVTYKYKYGRGSLFREQVDASVAYLKSRADTVKLDMKSEA
jgi:hypothetical protein